MSKWKIDTKQFENFCTGCLVVLGILMMGFLSFYSLLYTSRFLSNHDNIPQQGSGKPVLILLLMLVTLILIFGAGKWILRKEEHRKRNIRLLLSVVCFYAVIYGIAWAFFCKYYMTWDQRLVSFFAEQFALGIDDVSASDLAYIGAYPHQLGLIAFMEPIYRLCGWENYHAFQAVNALAAGGIVFVGYRLVDKLVQREEADVCFLLLMLGCHPLYIYVSFVYGEVLSVLFSLIAVLGVLNWVESLRKRDLCVMAVSITLACLIRSNCYIVLAAIGCVLTVKSVSQKTLRHLAALALCVAVFFASHTVLVKLYEPRIGVSLSEGMPSILWVAMGLQEVEGGAGWHDESFYNSFVDESNSRQEAQEMGKQAVQDSLKTFVSHPGYAVSFFMRKAVSQWNEPTYACQQETNPRTQERGPLAERLYKGDLKEPFTDFMDVYQCLIYFGVFLYLVTAVRRKIPLEHMLLFIVVFGGFLFYLFWEAKSRYIFPYFMMMIPMAACGWQILLETLQKALKGKTGRK